MQSFTHRTKIIATIGPASQSPEVIRQLAIAGMSVVRLNFSHGSYEDHAGTIATVRSISRELETPITLLQDLQGPKIRIGQVPDGEIQLETGMRLNLVPGTATSTVTPNTITIDYPHLAEEITPGTPILLDDGLLELQVELVSGDRVQCQVMRGGPLKSRKGVNLPTLALRLPALTAKDHQDLAFGVAQGIDWVSLSFVRQAEDLRTLKQVLADLGAPTLPVIAKIEKPQAIENLAEILTECDGVMVARGDLGVEISPERVPMLQKRIIRQCNERGIPVITATQMLESMIHNPRPTRAEASDVANAIADGTDAIMLSGESAVGAFPVLAVQMMVRIAQEAEKEVKFVNYPPLDSDEVHALAEALNTIDKIANLRCIVLFTTTGYTATIAAAERPRVPVIAFTPDRDVYHRLNLIWGVKPLLLDPTGYSLEGLIQEMESHLIQRQFVTPGDLILIIGGSPLQKQKGTNFLKIHRVTT